ncbi:type VI secretion system protein TssL, short form [Providencia rettgeri]|uniref:type VI secretion system protein TssL, short form n=1 Tax=Providencia rettgeri TaxID=587 RepID=UPI0034E07278
MSKDTTAQTIDNIFADTWLMACQLQQGVHIADGDKLYRHACQLIDHTRQLLTQHGYNEHTIEHMLYAQCALLDESVMKRAKGDLAYQVWVQSPLQARYFNTLDAGEQIWDRLRGLLAEASPNEAALTCFYRILTLGFVGKFRRLDHPEREQIVVQLNSLLPRFQSISELPLVVKPKLRFSRRRLYWLSWLTGVIVIFAMWWGFSTSLEHLLQQWMTQGQ